MSGKQSRLDADGRKVTDGCQIEILGWKPFLSVRFFVLMYGLMELAMIMFFAYYKSIITQLEKQFKLSAATLGIIDTSNDWSNVLFGVFIAYFGAHVHRPRGMALGMLVAFCGSVFMFLPHYLSDPYRFDGQDLAEEDPASDICVPRNWTAAMAAEHACSDEALEDERRSLEGSSMWKVMLVGQFIYGLGSACVGPFGISYINEAAYRHNTPMYLGALFMLALLGPACGYILGSAMIDIWVEFDRTETNITSEDPRWVGAWWLGYVIISCLLFLTLLPLLLFPRHLPKEGGPEDDEEKNDDNNNNNSEPSDNSISDRGDDNNNDDDQPETKKQLLCEEEKEEKKSSSCEFVKSNEDESPLKGLAKHVEEFCGQANRLIRNPVFLGILICHSLASAIVAGTVVFIAKYMENQFGISASLAVFLRGSIEIPFVCLGFLVGGLIMSRFKFTDSYAIKWTILTLTITICVSVGFFFVRCDNVPLAGIRPHPYAAASGEPYLEVAPSSESELCNTHCACKGTSYNPICGTDGLTYLSPCHAGCLTRHLENGSDVVASYSDCACVAANSLTKATPTTGVPTPESGVAVPGKCKTPCGENYKVFMALMTIASFISSLHATPSYVIFLHSIDKKDQSFAIGFRNALRKTLGWMSAPLYFGATIDGSCLLWSAECVNSGFCKYYDNADYTYRFYGLLASLKVASLIAYAVVLALVVRRDRKRGKEKSMEDVMEMVS